MIKQMQQYTTTLAHNQQQKITIGDILTESQQFGNKYKFKTPLS
jgi:hypothetical protein